LVSGFVDAGVLVVFASLLVCALLLAGSMARMLGINRSLAAVALASIAGILAVTLGVRAVKGGELGGASLGWLINGDLWSQSVDVGSGWLLNVALFVPAGLFVALATRRPWRALLGLAVLSLLIELVQSLGLLGAPDPADLVANSLGAAIGVSLAAIALRSSAWSIGRDEGVAASRKTVLVASAAVVGVAGIGWLGLLAGADAKRASLANDLRESFAGSTSTDIAARIEADDGFDQLLSAVETRPSYLGRVGNTNQFEGRYSIEFFGLHRCVFVRWTTDGFALRYGSGDVCTIFRERPPDS
jgi:hypothetical protein